VSAGEGEAGSAPLLRTTPGAIVEGTESAAPPSKARRQRDRSRWRKALIPILIAAVSVTGALFTWWAAALGAQAATNDERAITESAIVARNEARVESRLGTELGAFARYLENQVLADQLEAESKRPGVSGDDAATLQAQARSAREIAQDLAALYFDRSQYVDESLGTFDVEKRRQDLRRDDLEAQRVAPARTAARANHFRSREERVVTSVVVLALAVVVLTVAQTTRFTRLKPWIAGVGTGVWVLTAAVSILGDPG
jgi:hypothetical protein